MRYLLNSAKIGRHYPRWVRWADRFYCCCCCYCYCNYCRMQSHSQWYSQTRMLTVNPHIGWIGLAWNLSWAADASSPVEEASSPCRCFVLFLHRARLSSPPNFNSVFHDCTPYTSLPPPFWLSPDRFCLALSRSMARTAGSIKPRATIDRQGES